jgi:primosomal protein N' (replication factor Y)
VVLSARLRLALADTLGAGEQAIVLLNRRGWASFVLCRECGQKAECPRCSVCLVFHRAEAALRCHHCEHREPVRRTCGKCQGSFLHLVGQGTERVEQAVREALPAARVGRLDRDAVRRRGELDARLASFAAREIDVLVGTQMVAKGHDFPGVTLVGVVSVDALLALPDFRTTERAFALLTQVAGRSGRGERRGRVLLQTYQPDNEAVRLACAQDYRGFFAREMRLRRALGYPPAGHLALLGLSGRDRARVMERAQAAAIRLRAVAERRPRPSGA